VLNGLEAATNIVDDMDEWLGIFNIKLRHMREDIESIETRNNKLEMQSVNNKALIEELDKVIERLRVPSEYAASLTGGSFDEADMLQNIEACEWLAKALRGLEVPNLDPIYANMRAVKEKRAELEKLKATFVRRASEFLRNYFASLVDFMISDKSYFSQRGQLKRPDHADLRYKCRTYARLLQHLKGLDKNCLGPLRKAYCSSLNLLLRREAREFANELRASTKVSRNPTVWLEGSTGSSQNANTDTSAVSDAYAKMLTIFIPLLVDESSFFAHFMCFEVPALAPPGGSGNDSKNRSNNDDGNDDDDLGIMDIDETDKKTGKNSPDLTALNESLQDLLDGIQEDFYAVVDWAYKIDPLRCISMHGITERYLSGQKADAAGFVRLLLGDLESRVSMQFSRFVDEACHQIERNERNVRQMGVLPYIPRFAALATRMEQYIQGQSRDLVDQAYTKFVSIMFVTLEKIAQQDPKYADILLLENYAAFQNSLYDLANVVPTLAKFYHQASEAYEQACTRHISMIIYYQFERLFQFAKKIEDFMYTITPEEIPFQLGLSKMELRKMLKSSLSGVDKSIAAMYKKLQKNLASEELLPSLWDKCKKEFLDKYESFVQLVAKVYPNENVPGVTEMRGLLASMCECFDLYDQLIPYKKAWSWQKSIVNEKKALIDKSQECSDTVILLQHSPVYTMGTGSSEDYLNFDIKNAPFDLYRTERGGEVTYHGPGQLVMYPIINLRNHKMDLHWYLRMLEEVVIRVLSSAFSIKASRLDGLTGVWVGNQKVAAIGIRVSKWMTYHGLALNVTTDLTPFNWIVPCGIRNRWVGSIKGLIEDGGQVKGGMCCNKLEDLQLIDLAHESLLKEFSEVFQLQIEKQTVLNSYFLNADPLE
ncbi:unnamed protein product, partial [Arabis nemorensis]